MDASPVITILPEPPTHLADAVRDGGGVTAPLSEATSGLVVLAGEPLEHLENGGARRGPHRRSSAGRHRPAAAAGRASAVE